jgi:hypothetical protein
MIVSDDTVSKALAYLADDPHPIALARKALTDTENDREEQFAKLFKETTGSIKERECHVEALEHYQSYKDREAEAQLEYERHRARVRAAEMIIEVWRSENANARAAERVR